MTRAYGVKGCSELGCEREHYGKGLCNLHWARARGPVRRAAPTEKTRRNQVARQRKKLTGWTPEMFAEAMTAQSGLCALCSKPFDDSRGGKAVADHNHSTGRARGLLHGRCNLAVGQYEQHKERLRSYLETYDGEN